MDDSDARGKEGTKQRGLSDATLAAQLHSELAGLLAVPLHQKMNAKFFTGGTSQQVAASMVAHGDVEGLPAAAMQKSVALATSLVQAKADDQSRNKRKVHDVREGQAGAARKKKKAPTLAETQAAALQRALEARQRKKGAKQGAQRSAAGVVSSRAVHGVDALAALKA